MTEFRWADPPTARDKALEDLKPLAEALREHPKRWAVVEPQSRLNLRQAARLGEGPFSPPGAFEAKRVSTDLADGGKKVEIYVRYLGDTPASDEATGPAGEDDDGALEDVAAEEEPDDEGFDEPERPGPW